VTTGVTGRSYTPFHGEDGRAQAAMSVISANDLGGLDRRRAAGGAAACAPALTVGTLVDTAIRIARWAC
jgi:hypothetical protein